MATQHRTMRMAWFCAGLLMLSLVAVTGCIGVIKGRVSTALNAEVPQQASFVVHGHDLLSETPSLTEKQIINLLTEKMLALGFLEAPDVEHADLVLGYRYAIGQSQTVVTSQADPVWGGHAVGSYTRYPRRFELFLVDAVSLRDSQGMRILWQGELYSAGRTYDIAVIAPFFIDELFQRFGRSTVNERFARPFP